MRNILIDEDHETAQKFRGGCVMGLVLMIGVVICALLGFDLRTTEVVVCGGAGMVLGAGFMWKDRRDPQFKRVFAGYVLSVVLLGILFRAVPALPATALIFLPALPGIVAALVLHNLQLQRDFDAGLMDE